VRGARHVRNQGELAQLTGRFIGAERADEAFRPRSTMRKSIASPRAGRRILLRASWALFGAGAGRLGAGGGQMGLDDVTRLLDEGVQSLRFSRQLLAASFENLPSGISVVDSELNLVAWNSLYIELFGYPPGLVRVGVPIADLIRFNIERGGFPDRWKSRWSGDWPACARASPMFPSVSGATGG
jgi:PAS domain-containing protein